MRLSYSQVDTYQRCPQAYKLRYVDRIPTAPSSRMVLGTALHTALARYHQPARPAPPPFEEVADCYAESYKAELADDSLDLADYEFGLLLLQRYCELHAADQRQAASCELPFTIPLGDDLLLRGKIDRIDAVAPGELAFWDYKSGKMPAQPEVDEDLQLALYALAGRHLYPDKQVTAHLYYLMFDQVLTPRLTPERLETARLAVAKVAADITAGWFEPRVGPQCDWCDVKPACTMWKVPGQVETPVPPEELLARAFELSRQKSAIEREYDLVKSQVRLLLEQAAVGAYRAGGYVAKLNIPAKKVYDIPQLRKVLDPLGLFDQVAKVESRALAEVADALDPATRACLDACCRREAGAPTLRIDRDKGYVEDDQE